jgi:hypothetical protein
VDIFPLWTEFDKGHNFVMLEVGPPVTTMGSNPMLNGLLRQVVAATRPPAATAGAVVPTRR